MHVLELPNGYSIRSHDHDVATIKRAINYASLHGAIAASEETGVALTTMYRWRGKASLPPIDFERGDTINKRRDLFKAMGDGHELRFGYREGIYHFYLFKDGKKTYTVTERCIPLIVSHERVGEAEYACTLTDRVKL